MLIDNLINKFSGCPLGFVVGSGPSLRHVSNGHLKLISKYPIISVNSAISKFTGSFDNLFFISDDIDATYWDYYIKTLPKLNCTYLLFKDKLKGTADHLDPERVLWFSHKTWYQPSTKIYFEDGLFLTKGEPIIGARTAAGSAVHFQYIFGVKNIILLGCDCCYEKGQRYFWQFSGQTPCKRLDKQNVFSTPNKGKFLGQPVDQHSLDFLVYWTALAKQVEKQSVNVINASGGILQWFPRMTLDKVLEQFGDRRK